MDLSALIFVALAAAWAVYLVPKALKHHEDDSLSRSVERFSERLRVLARREPATALAGAPTAAPTRTPVAATPPATGSGPAAEHEDEEYVLEPVRLSPVQLRMRRAAARRAAERRRRVLTTLLGVLVLVVVVAALGRLPWLAVAAPAALVVAWLVACRLMVKKEIAARTTVVRKRRTTLADQVLAEEDAEPTPEEGDLGSDSTEEISAVTGGPDDGPGGGGTWEPVPVTLPTYVGKAAATRTVRTIDLDSTGVWSSGRNSADSELAREAEQQRPVGAKAEAERRASGA